MPTFSQVMKSPFIELNADSTIATNTSHGMGYILGKTKGALKNIIDE